MKKRANKKKQDWQKERKKDMSRVHLCGKKTKPEIDETESS